MYDYETANPDRYGLLKEFARKNRAGMTPCEKVLWEKLRKLFCGIKFRRQHPIADYIADFICLERKLIIEVDGKYHESPEQKAHDEIRTHDLEAYGYTILRFTNEDITYRLQTVINHIKDYVLNK